MFIIIKISFSLYCKLEKTHLYFAALNEIYYAKHRTKTPLETIISQWDRVDWF